MLRFLAITLLTLLGNALGLIIASWLVDGFSVSASGVSISDVTAWIIAPLIIWLTTVLAGVVLPLFLFKKTMANVKDKNHSDEGVS